MPEAASAVAEHRVDLGQRVHALPDRIGGDAEVLRRAPHRLLLLRKELVERRIEQPDRHGPSRHFAEDPQEVLALHRQDLRERGAPLLLRVGEDHLAHGEDALLFEEHVLGAAEPDPFGAEEPRDAGVLRRVRVGPDAEPAPRVGPGEEPREGRGDGGLLERHGLLQDDLEDLGGLRGELSEDHLARRPVDGDPVELLRGKAPGANLPVRHVDGDLARSDDARLSHAPRHDGRVGRHAAARRQDPDGGVHARDVFRRRLLPHEHHRLALRRRLDGVLRGEADSAARRSRAGGQTFPQEPFPLHRGLLLLAGEHGREQLHELLRLDPRHGLVLRDQALVDHLGRDPHGGEAGALPVAGLQEVEPCAPRS